MTETSELEELRIGYECNTAILHARTRSLNTAHDEIAGLRAILAIIQQNTKHEAITLLQANFTLATIHRLSASILAPQAIEEKG